jgi:4-amino-4-deoxy-L-arabinose transferase-like glycosyltransferase
MFRASINRSQISLTLIILLIFFGSFVLIFSRAMEKGYNRDENQFVASGELLARNSLLPYRDYPHFHMPNLVFVYGLIFQFTDYVLLGARVFSVICAASSAVLLFILTYNFFKEQTVLLRAFAGLASVFLLLPNPLFIYTSGLAWNHDFPIFLTLLAVVAYLYSALERSSRLWIFISGVLVGLAIGTRLLFVTAVIPFLVTLVWHPGAQNRKGLLNSILLLSIGVSVGLIPSFLLFLLSPNQFIFGNLVYPNLNTMFRLETGFEGPIGLFEKIVYVFSEVLTVPGNLLLFLASLFFAFSLGVIDLWIRKRIRFEFLLISLLILFIAAGSFLPSPAWYQYFYAPVPFAILGIMYGISRFNGYLNQKINLTWILFVQILILVNIFGLDQYSKMSVLTDRTTWFPLRVRILGHQIENISKVGRVLTLSPVYLLDGNSQIYPEFASGPFAWRISQFVPSKDRKDLSLVSETDLNTWLESDPPGGILVGLHNELERSLVRYALENGYQEIRLSELVLFVP